MGGNFRRILTFLVTFLGGLYFFLEYALPAEINGWEFGKYHEQISKGVQVVGVMAIGLGLINILFVHGGAIIRSRKGWVNSAVLFAGLILMFTFEGLDFVASEKAISTWKPIRELQLYSKDILEKNSSSPEKAADRLRLLNTTITEIVGKESSRRKDFIDSTTEYQKLCSALDDSLVEVSELAGKLMTLYQTSISTSEQLKEAHGLLEQHLGKAALAARELVDYRYQRSNLRVGQRLLYEGFFVPLGAAMFSLLAFYIATAAYRTFRVRSWEAAIMMTAALLVMLGQIPHGPLYISEYLPDIRRWFMRYLNTPAFRAIYFGSIIAGLATATRIWFSLERGVFLSEDSRSTKTSSNSRSKPGGDR